VDGARAVTSASISPAAIICARVCAGPGWLFLTGAPYDIDHLRRALGFAYSDPVDDADVSNHIGMLRYGAESDAIRFWQAGLCGRRRDPISGIVAIHP
jgi:hypothetical protein